MRLAAVVGSFVMRPYHLLALLALALPAVARAANAPPDSGRFIIFQGDVPVANEKFVFQYLGDSLALTAVSRRTMQDEQGQRHNFEKTMLLVADARDLGLQRFHSTQEFRGNKIQRGLLPGDTSITFYFEENGGGEAFRLVQPPGRLYVMDSPMFSLFEVVTRGLVGKTFTSRRMQLLALTDSMSTPLATVTTLKPDTLRSGELRVPVSRYRFEDTSASFDLYADSRGRLIRLVHEPSGLHVEREPDPVAVSKAKKPKKK
jgi:hypothetical protein